MRVMVDFIAERPGGLLKSFGRNRLLFPLILFGKELRERGVHIKFVEHSDRASLMSGEVLCLDSRVFTNAEGRVMQPTLDLVAHLRDRYDWVVWFDNRDSSGTTQFEVLALVDRYAKKQILSDRTLYTKPLYAGRLHTDFLHDRYGICDSTKPESSVLLPNLGDMPKLTPSWNLAYSDFRSASHWQRYLNYGLGFRPPLLYAERNRTVQLQARFGTEYDSEVITFHRRSYLDMAKKLAEQGTSVACGRVSLRDYKQEMRHALAVLSPFGWGEVCFRDFEAMQNGCALIKPCVEHMDTWPDLFQDGETYLSLPWDVDDATRRLPLIMDDRPLLRSVGAKAQKRFRRIWDPEGARAFAEHFCDLVVPASGHDGGERQVQAERSGRSRKCV